MNREDYQIPVWTTQFGGLMQRNDVGQFVFIEVPPKFRKHQPGDLVPEECEAIAANPLAEEETVEDIVLAVAEEEPDPEEDDSDDNPFGAKTFVGHEGGPNE